MRAKPQTSGTTAFCLFPYTKKPSPIEPKSNPQRSQDSFNVVSMSPDVKVQLHLGPFSLQ